MEIGPEGVGAPVADFDVPMAKASKGYSGVRIRVSKVSRSSGGRACFQQRGRGSPAV